MTEQQLTSFIKKLAYAESLAMGVNCDEELTIDLEKLYAEEV